MNELLSVRGLTKRYPGFTLDSVSFSVAPGRIMGLIGKNGAGKSTTLKAILNLIPTDGGSVTLLDQDVRERELTCKAQVGVVFGGLDYYPLKRLSAITRATRRFYSQWDQDRYETCLHRFGLEEEKPFKALSNGMKVKYLLALALSHHARLLLLDEPTSGLDPVSRDEILHLFTRIVSDGSCSILFSTHITSDLDRCAHDITYLHNGQVLASAPKDAFQRAFDQLRTPEEQEPLTLEEIMLRTERRDWDETAL
ncbi:ABC transporter ATP-binding protein [Flavonifractor sp. An91]|uniref:ABC transporter ATP-binding protein n=1 Tax=Flavonifractor sp. An91 TaxID=1965665 RepID=UPI000B378FA6|nr:ABC transporter ATP-binding protein [Flavonifractor sp. An91]OUN14287.1 ABC transporter ATP-binding protein [Flavonifractor sp. An91]